MVGRLPHIYINNSFKARKNNYIQRPSEREGERLGEREIYEEVLVPGIELTYRVWIGTIVNGPSYCYLIEFSQKLLSSLDSFS